MTATVSRRIHLEVHGDLGAGAVSAALQVVAQSVVQLQEAIRQEWQDALRQQEERMQAVLRQQEQKAREDIRRALCLQEQEANRRLQETRREIEEKDKAVRGIIQEMEERLGKVERKMEHLVRQLPHSVREMVEVAGVQEEGESLEGRMTKLETSVQRALGSLFPRVNALVTRLEGRSPIHQPSSIPSTCSATTFRSPCVRISSSLVASESLPSTASIQPPPTDHAIRESLGEELLQAAKEGNENEVERLLNSGADPNYPNMSGFTPLMFASLIGHESLVSLLLQRGADVQAKENFYGRTALHIVAARRGVSSQCIPVLLEAGAPVDSRSGGGWTPLHWAAWNKNYAAVQVLLSSGASKMLSTDDGRTPLHLASSEAIRRLLCS